jgi:hypothetical protein
MAFDRSLLLSLGGFDEALDTGAPLPGGGDLDIFYRVLRSGRAIVYEPRYAVYHEHRETLPQLRRQYWTWGLGFMAFLTKSRRSDPALKRKQSAILRWWLLDKLADLGVAACCLRFRELGLTAELGGIVGMAGEYDARSSGCRKFANRRQAARDIHHVDLSAGSWPRERAPGSWCSGGALPHVKTYCRAAAAQPQRLAALTAEFASAQLAARSPRFAAGSLTAVAGHR